MCAQFQRLSLQLFGKFRRKFSFYLTLEQRQRRVSWPQRGKHLECSQRWLDKAVPLKIGAAWIDTKNSRAGNMQGEGGGKESPVSKEKPSRSGNWDHTEEAARHSTPRVTAQRQWVPVVGTTNRSFTIVSAQRHCARLEDARHNACIPRCSGPQCRCVFQFFSEKVDWLLGHSRGECCP